jgi:DNA-directed RNA polymerase specialized sigma24 family protein
MPDQLDADLLRRFVQGDRDAFEALFRQFEIEVYRWSLAIVRDTTIAEDVVVEAFWRASPI